MKKIAIINQRYGLEVNGGSEYYTRLIAEHLKKYYDVEILTTTALDYSTWKNYYSEGLSNINGITVRRFWVKQGRSRIRFGLANRIHRLGEKVGCSLDSLWVKEQGPYVPELIDYIKEHKDDYDKFIFVTYLYYPTVRGIRSVYEKSILIPTAHDEPYIYYDIYKDIFKKSCAIIYLTEEEKHFVEKTFANEDIPNTVTAVGIDVPNELNNANERVTKVNQFRLSNNIKKDYIIYAGRVDSSKCCDEMIEFYLKYVDSNPCNLDLVIIGKSLMEIPENDRIHYLGFVSDEDKMTAIAGAKYLWLPSEFESLSIALLEGMALGVPGIVNGRCEVLQGHAKKSKAAFVYSNWEEFEECMNHMLNKNDAEYQRISRLAREYVFENYSWDVIEEKLLDIIESKR